MSETFEKQAQLYAALSRAQGQFPAIPRNRTVTVRTKTGGSYKFDYAPLETILDHVRAPLAAEGLAISQALLSEDGHTFLETTLLHANGGSLSSKLVLSRAEQLPPQELGSLLTYLRRYSLQALLGIATEEDDDANSASGNTVTKQETRQRNAGETGGVVAPEPGTAAAAAATPHPAPSPAEPELHSVEWWDALSPEQILALVPRVDDAGLLRDFYSFESNRRARISKNARKGVGELLKARIKILEGDSEAGGPSPAAAGTDAPVSQDGNGASALLAESAEPLQELQACLAFIAEQPAAVDNASFWTPTNVLVGLSTSGAGEFSSLGEVPAEWLGKVLEKVPGEVRGLVASMGPESRAKLAEAVA